MSYSRLSAGKVLPRRLQEAMDNLQAMFGNDLQVTKLDHKGATFYVHSMSDKSLIREMINKTHDIFGARSNQTPGCVLGPSDFQILCASNPRGGRGLTLRYLDGMPDGGDYQSGYWFY